MGRTYRAGALGAAASLALTFLIAPAAPAIAAPSTAPREVAVFPAYKPTVWAQEQIRFVGATGFLHQHNTSSTYLWTRYDTGQTVAVKDLNGVSVQYFFRSPGGDRIAFLGQVPAKPAPGKVSILDLSDMSWQQWEIPTGYTPLGVFGQSMLVRKQATELILELRTFAADGTSTITPVTGLPSDATIAATVPVEDAESAVIPFRRADQTVANGLLDIATATVVEIPEATSLSGMWRLTGDTLAWSTLVTDVVRVYSRSALRSGSGVAPRQLPLANSTYRYAVVGDHVLTAQDQLSDTKQRYPTRSVPIDGGDAVTLLPETTYGVPAIAQGPDGSALVVGGTGPRDWAVYRFTPTDGTPTGTKLLSVADPAGTAAVTYDQGVVRHLQYQVSPLNAETQYLLYNHPLVPDTGVVPSAGMLASYAAPCATGVRCVRLVDGNHGGTAYLTYPGPTSGDTVRVFNASNNSYTSWALATRNGRIVDAGGDYVIINDGSTDNQLVVQIFQQTRVVRSGPVKAATLWYDTLWTVGSTSGVLIASDLGTSSTRTIQTDIPCVPKELQASLRWIYWSCGADGPAGVYDIKLDRTVRVPSGPALLGDGFVVRHDAASASLLLTDFHDGSAADTVKLADLPVGTPADGRGITWSVDRHGSGVAYLDADNSVHVIDTEVPVSGPEVGTSYVQDESYPHIDWRKYWRADFELTRPLQSWQLKITRKATGEEVARPSAGVTRRRVLVGWDGRLASGEPALNGVYLWQLTGTVEEGGPELPLAQGQLRVTCGTFGFHSYDCYGAANLLGVKSTGEGRWYGERLGAEPAGHLYDLGATDKWCLSCSGSARTSALVPFGDIDGDGMPDLLVRDGSGGMLAYLGTGRPGFGGTSALSLGDGWMLYKSILAPGDVNGDGHDDILGIDANGKMWLYTTTGTGRINPRVQVGAGWNIYTRVIGAGDLNGDGHGDLLGIDASGVMYHYLSTGDKSWASRAKVFTGWNIYNTVIAIGDLNQDGRHDLVARDANGVLWFYAGLGNGSFAARTKAGAGWNMYKIII